MDLYHGGKNFVKDLLNPKPKKPGDKGFSKQQSAKLLTENKFFFLEVINVFFF